MEYRSNRNILFRCIYHVVWCPKYRRRVLTGPVEVRLREILYAIAEQLQVTIMEMEVMPDHVHLLLDADPTFGIHRVVKRLKGRSSHDLRSEFPSVKSRLPTLWTNSYFVATTGGAPLSAIKKYIEGQKREGEV